jgi:hypothetical protein
VVAWRGKRSTVMILLTMMALLTLSACGTKYDLDVFIMPKNGLPDNVAGDVKQALQAKLGEDKKIQVIGSPIYNAQKMLVEFAAGEHDIIVLPKEDFQQVAFEGGAVPLDDTFDSSAYPAGVMEGTVLQEDHKEVKEKHLFGIPLSSSKMFKDAGYISQSDEMYMIVYARTKDEPFAKQALKEMVGQ